MRKRVLALVCCLSLTLGLFTYRPPEVKAIAIADDAIVTAVILSVMAYGGYKLWVDNLDASAIADIIKPHVKQWNYEHGSSAEDPFSGFAEWATGGMDKFRKSITPVPGGPGPDMNGISWVLSFALFDKVCQFAEWLGNRVGVKPGVAEPVPIAPSSSDIATRLFSVYDDFYVENYHRHAEKYDYMTYLFCEKTSGNVFLSNRYYLFMSNSPISVFHSNVAFDDGAYSHKAGYYLYTSAERTGDDFPCVQYLCFSKDFRYLQSEAFYFNYRYHYRFLFDSSDIVIFDDSAPAPSATLALPGTWSPSVPAEGTETVPMVIPGATPAGVLDVDALVQEILNRVTKNELVVQPSGSPAPDPGTQPDTKPSINPGTDTEGLGLFGWLKRIWESIIALPAQIAEVFHNLLQTLFVPDPAVVQEIATTFTDKFPFLPALNRMGTDLFGMTADSDPPVIWIHLEDAEGKYIYGDKTKVLDMSFYQRYKADADKLISGFLWLGFLWLLFKRASAIIQGGEMLTEYSEAIDRGYRERKGKKTK